MLYRFDYYDYNGCCLVCEDKICNDGRYCPVCWCKECRWREYVPEVGYGFCSHPSRKENPQFDDILQKLGLRKIGGSSKAYEIWKKNGWLR